GLIAEVGGSVMVVLNLDVGEIRRNEGKRAALVGVPDPGFLQRIKIGHELHEILCDLRIVPNAPVPDFGTAAASELDFGIRIKSTANILEIRVPGEIEFLQIAAFEAKTPERGQIRDRDVLKV